MPEKDDRPYKVVLADPEGEVILSSEYYGGVSISEDLIDELQEAYGKHRESRGLKTAFYSDEGSYNV